MLQMKSASTGTPHWFLWRDIFIDEREHVMNSPRKALVFCSLLLLGVCASALGAERKGSDAFVRDLLSRMSIEEKIGQMTQITLDVVTKNDGMGPGQQHELDMERLREAIVTHHVGSLFNVRVSAYSVDQWNEAISIIQDVATKETRLHIPILYGLDGVHGQNYTLGATVFPQPLSMAATWNPDLVRKEGEITAYEMRASGVPWNFYPVEDVGRQPVWPRVWETFGEDVHMASTMTRAYIEGHQGDSLDSPDKGAVCLKHYIGYSFPLTGKDRTTAWISERMIREYFLPPFEEGIKAGATTIMVNSGDVDGIPGHANHHFLTEVLRRELDFRGMVVSDYRDIIRLHDRYRIAATPKEAVRMAVMAGVDMSMVPSDYSFYDLLLECVKEGSVPVSRIDEAVSRILWVKYQVGLFERPYPDTGLKAGFASKEFSAANLQAAEESITLLKNDGWLLPLSKKMKVLVTGPAASTLSPLNGGWTITWQGDREELYPKGKPTILRAIQNTIGKDNVSYVPGSTFDKILDLAAVNKAAKNADAIVLCLGEPAYCETPGNIFDLMLDSAQLELAGAAAKTGKPVVLVLAEGRPRIIRQVVGGIRAIVMAYRPGMEGGTALANILFGDVCPSGKLPITYPRYPNDLTAYDFTNIDSADGNSYDPQFAFGHGLSYTSFSYSDLKLSRNSMHVRDTIHVSVTVTNTGKVAGKEVVQLYLHDNYGSVSRPARQLKGFQKVNLEPGQRKTVEFTLSAPSLSFIGQMNRRIVEPGGFTVMIDKLSADFALE
jgi:beta-glucosidase